MQYVALHPDAALMRATWHDHIPSFTLDAQGIGVAIAIGLALWLSFQVLWRGLAATLRLARGAPANPSIGRPPAA
jgi:hypothetical protein